MAREILISAGEASGDALAAELVSAARRLDPELTFFGATGPALKDAGVERVVDTADLSVMGLTEVLPRIPRIWAALRRLGRVAVERRPVGAILVDAPDFHLRLAPRLDRAGIPVVQYVSPTIWAWRGSRVARLERSFRRVLLTLPFEAAAYADSTVDAVYVGHPVVDRRPRSDISKSDLAARVGLPTDRPWVALLPGSRAGELSRMGGLIADAGRLVRGGPTEPALVACAAPGIPVHAVKSALKDTPDVTTDDEHRFRVLAACDAAIATSGTVSLELAVLGVPHVVAYRMSTITHWIARRLVRTPFIALPNLIAGRAIVPEFVQSRARPETVAAPIIEWLEDPREAATVRRDLIDVTDRLGPPGVAQRAARAALEVFAAEN